MPLTTEQLQEIVAPLRNRPDAITVLTGAGISAESGIPTFRGPEGYWTVGSKVYQPQEMATLRMFRKCPFDVWAWYLYRLGICRQAEPNPGHHALVKMESLLGDRFTLITQNVDGLHIRAGNSPARTYQIHGNIDYVRCVEACGPELLRMPGELKTKTKGESLSEHEKQRLHCPTCNGLLRPHVLWFDESYDEHYFRFYSSLKVAQNTRLLVIVGTSGATNLPNQIAWQTAASGGTIIDINIEENPFSRIAARTPEGGFCQAPSSQVLPQLAEALQ
jgi:NAD-dependent deacetylase